MSLARAFTSRGRLLERLGIAVTMNSSARAVKFKLTHYPVAAIILFVLVKVPLLAWLS